jgi:hypothetical protein
MSKYINERTALYLKKGVEKLIELEKGVYLKDTTFKIASNIGPQHVGLTFMIFNETGTEVLSPVVLEQPYQQITFNDLGTAATQPLQSIRITADADVHMVLHIDIPEEAKHLHVNLK